MSDTIKPCPFCGATAELTFGTDYSWVSCVGCCADGPSANSDTEAIAAWNAAPRLPRATTPPLNTVRVRVAVAVSPDGNWLASGGKYDTDAFAEHAVKYATGDRLTWITADVPKPEPAAEIEAEVEPTNVKE